MDAGTKEIQERWRGMKLLIEVEKDYYEMIKYNVEHGQEYKPAAKSFVILMLLRRRVLLGKVQSISP